MKAKPYWFPGDLIDSDTLRPFDTLYFRATHILKKDDDEEWNEGLIDEAGERFAYLISHYVCFTLAGDPAGSYRLSRKKYVTKDETKQAAEELAAMYAGKATLLNLMPFDEALGYYVRFI